MFPRWHILLGALFSLLIWLLAPGLPALYVALIFLSSVFIDADHYFNAVMKTKELSLAKALRYHNALLKQEIREKKRGIIRKGEFHIFHTLEFHFLIGLLGFLWIGFFYIFLGMTLHSLLDVISLLKTERFYRREFFLINWVWRS